MSAAQSAFREQDLGAAWSAAIRRGDFSRAWEIADQVLVQRRAGGPCWGLPRHEQWIWDGRALAGQRVLVRCYHGLGDTLQFARFLPSLKRAARETTVWAQASLLPLLHTMPAPMRLLPLHDGPPELDYDVDLEIMELAHALRVPLSALSAEVPYFDVPPAERLSQRCSIGVVTQSGDWDARRSFSGDLLQTSLASVESVELFSLQLPSALPGMVDASSTDILTLAGRLKALDLVITVDTMMAHLAGALGVPTWTLLPFEADWRWLEGRSDSPWYPTMRLFRQPRPGDWPAVVDEVRRSLVCAR